MVCLGPAVVPLTNKPPPKGSAVWLPDSQSLRAWSFTDRESFHGELWDVLGRNHHDRGGRGWEILHRGDSSVKKSSLQAVHKDPVVSRRRDKKICFFLILPFQLKSPGPWHALSNAFLVSVCSEFFLRFCREALDQHNLFYYDAMSCHISPVHIWLTRRRICGWAYRDTYYHNHQAIAFIECLLPHSILQTDMW